MKNLILIAEDEENIRKLVAQYLVGEGYKVITAGDGIEAVRQFESNADIVLVILDVMMPKMDGYEACRLIREQSAVPILMLTARDSEFDELTGFNSGADEYIAKPFSPAILITRVRNLLKRTGMGNNLDIEAGGLKLLFRERTIYVDGVKSALTPKEFELLHYLMQNKNLVLTRDQILINVWDYDYGGDDRTVDTHIKCLRAKLGNYGKHIITLRKVGYKFEYPLSAE